MRGAQAQKETMLAAPRSTVLSLLVWLTSFVAIRADDDDDDEDDEVRAPPPSPQSLRGAM